MSNFSEDSQGLIAFPYPVNHPEIHYETRPDHDPLMYDADIIMEAQPAVNSSFCICFQHVKESVVEEVKV